MGAFRAFERSPRTVRSAEADQLYSRQPPSGLIDAPTFHASGSRLQSLAASSTPRSEWQISPGGSRRSCSAMRLASTARLLLSRSGIDPLPSQLSQSRRPPLGSELPSFAPSVRTTMATAARWKTLSRPQERASPPPSAVAKVAPLVRPIGDADAGQPVAAGRLGPDAPPRQRLRNAGIVPAADRPRSPGSVARRADMARHCPRSYQRLRHRSERRWRRRTKACSFMSLANGVLATRMPGSCSSASPLTLGPMTHQ